MQFISQHFAIVIQILSVCCLTFIIYSNNKIIMSIRKQNEWNYLFKLQEQRLSQQEAEEREMDLLRKKQYKQQLQRQIEQQRNKNKNNRLEDIEMLKHIQTTNNIKEEQEKNFQHKLSIIKHTFAKDNLLSNEYRTKRQMEEKIRENQLIEENVKKQKQEAELKILEQMQSRRRQKTELASSYEQRIHQTELKKKQQKLQDAQYMEVSSKLADQKQKQRRQYLDKIRFGYHQNPQTYSLYDNLIKKKDEQKEKILEALLPQASELDTLDKEVMSSKKTVEARKQLESLYRMKTTLQNPEQLDKLKDRENKLLMRLQLQKQIEQNQKKKMSERNMDNLEVLINKQAFYGPLLLPGRGSDHGDRLRREILNKSVGINRNLRMKTVQQ